MVVDPDKPVEPLDETELERMTMFPLPQTTLFPGQVLPLHLFEPRYRAMGEHLVRGGSRGALAIASLQPGYEHDYYGAPAVFPIMGAGRLVAHRRLDDGRWNIALLGLERVRLVEELDGGRPFREARLAILSDRRSPGDAAAADRLRALVLQLAERAPSQRVQLGELMARAKTPGALSDIVAAHFVDSYALRHELLGELEVARRLEVLTDALGRTLLDVALREDAPHN